MDLVIYDRALGGMQLWLGDGTGSGFSKTAAGLPDGGDVNGAYFGLDVADLDGNGHLDVVRAYVDTTSGKGTLEAWVR